MNGPVLAQYPTDTVLVRGDTITIPVSFPDQDITGWTWVAQTRPAPDTEPAMDFAVTPGADPVHDLVLTLTPEQSAHLADGDGWDLQSLTPTVQTWVLCRSLQVEKDYTHD